MQNQTQYLTQIILNQLLLEPALTRRQLIDALHMRPATLYECINRLKNLQLVTEPDRKSKHTGRRAPGLQINPEFGGYLGLEIKFNRVLGVSLDAQGKPSLEIAEDLPVPAEAGNARRVARTVLRRLVQGTRKHGRKLLGVGLADPGLVDPNRGVALRAVNIAGWEEFPVKDWLEKEVGCPAVVLSGDDPRAYAEYLAHPAPRPDSLLYVELDQGIGAGLVKQGEVFLGFSGCALELGHVVVQENGPFCLCGNRGCLEAVIGYQGLRARVVELNRLGVQTSLRENDFSYDTFLRAVRANDKAAQRMVMETVNALGVGLAATITILNPQRIVFSGGLAKLGDLLLQLLRQQLALRCLTQALAQLQLAISQLDDYATARGAALYARQAHLSSFVADKR